MNAITQADLDGLFTVPKGKRSARIVTHDRGVQRIRWYVSGRRYHAMPVTREGIEATRQWVANGWAIVRTG